MAGPARRADGIIDLVRPARFEVSLLYCCPAGDVGSKVRLEAAGQAVDGAITQAHDPAPLPSRDRVPRKEVYEKPWATLALGAMELPKGRTQLLVRALSVPGRQVCELKAVRLAMK